ncbi:MAG TPA: prolyl oligopeptidase family serine peptidase [Thermoanaerobaculia bacterium]|nr:prolyl oligopeptidase family serine peptidase [Thermoanaerobaculia bacterium]
MRRFLLALVFLAPVAVFGQYRMPPKAIADVVDAPPPPTANVSPDGNWLLLLQQPPLLTISDLSQPELKLAGIRFDPGTHDQSRLLYNTALTLVRVSDGQSRPVTGLPPSPRMRFATWSPDSAHIAFTLSTRVAVELWVADTATAKASRLSFLILNQTLPRRPYEWMPNSRAILARTVPGQGAPPEAPRTPSGPAIQESRGRKAPARTYEDMLRDESDAALFEYHMQSRLALIPISGEPTPLGTAAMIVRNVPSPDGRFIEVETVHRPFSYTVPVERFPRRVEVWSSAGQVVKQIADLPLADQVPTDFDAVRTGPRNVEWRGDKPATLAWAEAQDQGNPRNDVPNRDAIFTLADPFTGTAAKLMDVPMRFERIDWGSDSVALVDSRRWRDRKIQTWRIDPSGKTAPELIFDRSSEDRYGDPGDPVTKTNTAGVEVLRVTPDGRGLFFVGEGASPEGARPFLSRFDLNTKKTTRLFRSDAPYYEMPVEMLDDRGEKIVTRRESVTEPPNWFVRDLRRKRPPVAITSIPNPTPQMANVKKELIQYKRKDGVDLNGTLYLPPGYDAQKDGPLPVLMWAYPAEFKSASAASQVTTSPHRFTRVTGTGSPIVFVLRGYAVLDNPTIPIVGEGKSEPNDTYVDQLVAGAQAAVDELVRRGVGDRNRMAIAGHSYGAFMTANLLAHSDLFRAGIARSGAYNRTLTPFSFQAEERTYWQARDVYTTMSPFTYADKINEPLLLIHGIDDDNTGTFPIQSERLYQALSGLGGTVRLVMLPKEAHGYRGRESVMHVLWEMDNWLEKYVKNAK